MSFMLIRRPKSKIEEYGLADAGCVELAADFQSGVCAENNTDDHDPATPKIIVFASVKGGCGKSTSALYFARQCSEGGGKVLLVDADPQGNLTSHLLRGESVGDIMASSAYDLILERKTLRDVARPVSGIANFDFVPASLQMAGMDIEFAGNPTLMLGFRDTVLSGNHEYIVIDCPPALSGILRTMLFSADIAMVPVQPDAWAMAGLEMLMAETGRLKRKMERTLEIIAVPALCSRADVERLRFLLPRDVKCAATMIPKSPSVRSAVIKNSLPGQPLLDAFSDLVEEVLL